MFHCRASRIKFEGRFSREIRSGEREPFRGSSFVEEKTAYLLALTRVTTDTPLVHIFLRFHAYSVNSTLPSWPHKSTTQWRVARESIFIVAKCIKLRYRQSLSYSCTRARLPSLQDFRACVCTRCAVCARCGQLTLNVSTWTG